jgi:hypothetical protein
MRGWVCAVPWGEQGDKQGMRQRLLFFIHVIERAVVEGQHLTGGKLAGIL